MWGVTPHAARHIGPRRRRWGGACHPSSPQLLRASPNPDTPSIGCSCYARARSAPAPRPRHSARAGHCFGGDLGCRSGRVRGCRRAAARPRGPQQRCARVHSQPRGAASTTHARSEWRRLDRPRRNQRQRRAPIRESPIGCSAATRGAVAGRVAWSMSMAAHSPQATASLPGTARYVVLARHSRSCLFALVLLLPG